MKLCIGTCLLRLALPLVLGALLPVSAHAQIGVQTVTLGYQDGTGKGTLTVVPLEHPQNATDPAPYRAQFILEKSSARLTGAGIYQYLPSSQNYLLAFVVLVDGRAIFYQGRTFPDPNNTGIAGGGSYFPVDNPQAAASWDITTSVPGTPPVTNDLSQQAAQMFTLFNQYRQANGQPALTRVNELDQAALAHATDMAKNNFLGTQGSDGSSIGDRLTRAGYAWQSAGEIVGASSTSSPEALVASLTGDVTRRQLLLSPSFRDCGIALVARPGSTTTFYWCLDLAAR
jgi:uncharacterized protein YkwD